MKIIKTRRNYPLKKLTTMKIGGPAKYFCEVSKETELAEVLKFTQKNNLPVFILGGGSNVLINDKGFDGLVIFNRIKGIDTKTDGTVTANSGENWDELVQLCVENNFAGVECLSGIPGSVGGAVVQNIGAYGQTLEDVVSKVYTLEMPSGKTKVFSAKECKFAYRNSLFKKSSNKYFVLKVELKLSPNGRPTTAYPQVKKHFENKPSPNLADLRRFIIRLRASKGYLIMPGYKCYKTAGSFFKNPVISQEQFEKIKPIFGDADLNRFWETPNGIKVAAAYLIEQAGFKKGYQDGKAGISPKHSLSVINLGNAKASDITGLTEKIKNVVYKKFGVKLDEEIQYI
ncbi:MAG: UDP-N-acetylmuramate dehydrogenase [Patescibacteria group bacterium]